MSLDFREFRGRIQPILTQSGLVLAHSAKGSSWELHAELSKSGNAIDSAKYDFGSILNKAGINISNMSKEEIDKLQRKIVGDLEKK